MKTNQNQPPKANPEALIPDADLQPVMQERLEVILTASALVNQSATKALEAKRDDYGLAA